jgi:predicted acetyltransferase
MDLEEISEKHEKSFLAMIEDYRERDAQTFASRYARKNAWDTAEFKKFLKETRAQRLDWKPGPNKTSISRYVLVGEGGEILPCSLLRFPLDKVTELDGGNIEVDVPPSIRGKNNGSMALALTLFEAVRAGLRRVLVTCKADDVAAKRVIEKNRGSFLDTIEVSEAPTGINRVSRYWINF